MTQYRGNLTIESTYQLNLQTPEDMPEGLALFMVDLLGQYNQQPSQAVLIEMADDIERGTDPRFLDPKIIQLLPYIRRCTIRSEFMCRLGLGELMQGE